MVAVACQAKEHGLLVLKHRDARQARCKLVPGLGNLEAANSVEAGQTRLLTRRFFSLELV